MPLCGFIDSACRVLKKQWPEALSMGRLHLKVSECFHHRPFHQPGGSEIKYQFSRCFASFASIKWKPYPLPQNVALSFIKQLQLLAESGPEKEKMRSATLWIHIYICIELDIVIKCIYIYIYTLFTCTKI